MPDREKDERWLYDETPLSDLGGRIYLGSVENAKNANTLQMHGITHAVNLCIDTYPHVLDASTQVKAVLKVNLKDTENANLSEHLPEIIDFIDSSLAAGAANRVMVFCRVGQSRSASVCLAYMVIVQRASLLGAFQHMHARRPIVYPNGGFRSQLLDMDVTLSDPEKRAEVDKEIAVLSLQGLGLFFPPVSAQFTRSEIEECLKLCAKEANPELKVRSTLIREFVKRSASSSSTSSEKSVH